MIAIGCLAPLMLLVAGGLIGHLVAGQPGMLWGAGIGFAVGGAVLGGAGWLLVKLKE